ncbi:hypothetical protein [Rhizobium sp. SG2393]|uniref:hypothetical protein n=1 Tax=Rhizobium sp. SG2393 TaxID=3276279 RepID=UPI00366EA97B
MDKSDSSVDLKGECCTAQQINSAFLEKRNLRNGRCLQTEAIALRRDNQQLESI